MTDKLTFPDVSGQRRTYEGLVRTLSSAPPVGHWPLDVVNGTNVPDIGSGGNDGTTKNSPTLGELGPIARISGGSRAMGFDGVNQFVHMGDVLDSVIGGADKKFSIAFWVTPDALPAGTKMFVTKYSDTAVSENGRQMYVGQGGGELRVTSSFQLTAGRVRVYDTTDVVLVVGQTTHVVATYDGSIDSNDGDDRWTVYIDGVSKALTNIVRQGALGDIPVGPAQFGIAGSVKSDASDSAFESDAKIAQAMIYDFILTLQDAKALHLCGRNGQ